NATREPSAEIVAPKLSPSPSPPNELTLTRRVVPATRSLRNTSRNPFVSPGTRLSAELVNAIHLPSADIEKSTLRASDCSPLDDRVAREIPGDAQARSAPPGVCANAIDATATRTATDPHRFPNSMLHLPHVRLDAPRRPALQAQGHERRNRGSEAG